METIAQRNRMSLTAVGVVVVYVALAITTHLVLLGIFPMLLSYRAYRREEPLASLALLGALVALIVSVSALTHH